MQRRLTVYQIASEGRRERESGLSPSRSTRLTARGTAGMVTKKPRRLLATSCGNVIQITHHEMHMSCICGQMADRGYSGWLSTPWTSVTSIARCCTSSCPSTTWATLR